MDFDQTQAIHYSFEAESEEESDKTSEKIPVSFLKVYKHKDLQEKDYPLFEGENIIGRHENCDICIPTKALSKQHSCIEIKGDNHFIHDKKSLNKTRRGKLFLTPEVRYELKTDDKILFADVECMYRIIDKNKTNIDSGSETGSESMLNNDTVPTTIIEDDYNDDSDASSDILQPTQCYQPTQLMKPNKAGGTLSFQVDSEEDSFIKEKSNITVKDTPAQRKKLSGKSKVLLADSDSDETSTPPGATLVFTEDGRSSEEDRLLNQPTQACVLDSDLDDETDDEENKDLLNEPTQRVGGTVIPESDDETDNCNVDMNAATQACHSLSDTDEDQQIATVAYTMDTDIKSNKKKSKQSTPIASLAPTVPYEMDADVSGVAETQSFMLDKDEELLTPIKAENSKTASSEQNNNLKNSEDEESDPIIPENLKEEILEEDPVAETEEQDLSHLFIMPTLACDMDEDVTDDPMDNIDTKEASEEGSTQQVDMEVTQVVGESDETQRVDDATQLVESPKKSDATQKFTDATQEIGSEDATQLITSPKKSKQSVKSTFNDDATLMVEDNAGNYDATIAVDAAGDDTVAVDADASVAIETDSDATQPLSETVPVINEANAETVGMNDQTQLIDGNPNSEVVSNAYSAEAKQQCDEDDDSTSVAETVPVENISSVDEPTQACFTPKKKGKYKGKGKKSKGVKMAKVVLEEEDEDQDKVIEEETQAYGISPVKSTKSTPSKKYGLVVEDATQPYGQSPVKKVQVTKQSISDTDEPTQLYGKSPVKTSSRISRSREIGKKTPAEDKIESNDSESSNDTLPVDEIEFVPDSESPQEDKPPLIPIPSRSPHKSALASPRRRSPSPSPSPKRVAFVGVREASIEKQPEESTEEEFSPVIERIPNSSPSSTSVSRSSRRTRGKKPQIDEAEEPKPNSRRGQPMAKDISREDEKSNKTRGSKKNRSQNEEEVKSEPKPRSRCGRKSEVKVDVVESQSTKVKSHEEEESLPEEMAVRSRRGKKIGSTEEVKPEEKSRSKKLGLKDEDKSEIKATIKPTRTSRKTTSTVNKEDKGDSNGQTKPVLEDQNVKPQPFNLKTQSSNQESSQESEIEQSNSGKTTQGKGKSTRKGLKSRDTGPKEEVDEIEESKAVEEPVVVEPKGRQSRKSATVSSNSELSSRNAETTTDTSRGKRGRKSAVAPQEAVALQTSKKKNEEVAREDLSLDESHSQPKSTRGKRASKKADTEKSVEEVPQQSKDTLTDEEEKEAAKDSMANTGSRSKRKSVQNPPEKDSVSDNKKKKISDNKSNQRVRESVSTSLKGRGARNVNSSQDVEPSSSVEETNSASFTRRTPKRGRGDGDTVLDNEIAASTPKVSKKGDNQLQSTPSRKRLSQDIQASPSLRRKSFGIKPKVMFTGVVDEPGEKIIKDLGGSMAETIQECTHLITDKIRRTVKLLGGISLGLQIITRQWLDDSKQAGIFLDSSKYILCDKAAEKQYKFSLRHSIETATHSSMLEGYRIHITKSVKPPPDTMAEILECSGAQVLKSLPKKKEDKMIIISSEEDKTLCHPALTNGIDIVSSEFILTGLLRQEIDIPSFRLFGDDIVKTPQKGRSRKR